MHEELPPVRLPGPSIMPRQHDAYDAPEPRAVSARVHLLMKSRLQAAIGALAWRFAADLINEYEAPPLSGSEELLHAFETAAASGRAGDEWTAFTAEICGALRVRGANQFLRLPPIVRTVHPRMRKLAPGYLSYLFRSRRFSPTLQKALTESPVGKPFLHPGYPLSSPLLIQHGYHLVRLLESTEFDLSGIRLVVEFGGGYGSFYRLLRNLGYRDRYRICDLPAMCALQRFYLRNVFADGAGVQPPTNLQWLSGDMRQALQQETAEPGTSVFFATWSLSETPLAVRNAISPAMAGFTYVLCAYQRTFSSYDNVRYFADLQAALPQFSWLHAECPVFADNFYLIGQKRP